MSEENKSIGQAPEESSLKPGEEVGNISQFAECDTVLPHNGIVDKKDDGYFPVPHCVFCEGLKKSELLLMVALYKLANRFGGIKAEKFFHSNNALAHLIGITEKTLIKARATLVRKQMIEVTAGYQGHGTEYQIIYNDDHKIKSPKKALERQEKKNITQARKAKLERQLKRAWRNSDGTFRRDANGLYLVSLSMDMNRTAWARLNENLDWEDEHGKVV